MDGRNTHGIFTSQLFMIRENPFVTSRSKGRKFDSARAGQGRKLCHVIFRDYRIFPFKLPRPRYLDNVCSIGSNETKVRRHTHEIFFLFENAIFSSPVSILISLL